MSEKLHSVTVELDENSTGKLFLDGQDVSGSVTDVTIECFPAHPPRVKLGTRPQKLSILLEAADVCLVEKEGEDLVKDAKHKRENVLYALSGAILAFAFVGLVGTLALFFF